MTDPGCPFCFVDAQRVFHAGNLVLGLWDGFPVSPGHALLVPRRHVTTWFDATAGEQAELLNAIQVARQEIEKAHRPDGFNIGINIGESAGQTVFHLHVHVIPRYRGDVQSPRGGVRRVLPTLADYLAGSSADLAAGIEAGSKVADAAASFRRTDCAASLADERADGAVRDVAAFGERILQLLDESRRTTTYKFAVLLALVDVCLERTPLGGDQCHAITTRDLAEKVLDLYWAHTAPFGGKDNWHGVLRQASGGNAEMLSGITKFRERFAADPSEPLSRARHKAPEQYARLLRTIEWKLIEMPLPRLQVIGNVESRFLYRIGWDSSVKRGDIDNPGFDSCIHLQPGVATHLVQLSGLLRPLVQRGWAAMIAGLNPAATDEARLQEFLFGSPRISLDPIRKDLRDLQNNRCFYCDARITGQADVDHFIPWARYPDNGIENLVVAHQNCNGDKRDFLATGAHVQRWRDRFRLSDSSIAVQLAEIASRAGWDRHPVRTVNVARAIYEALPGDVQLWVRKREFLPVNAQRVELLQSLAL